MKYTAGIISFNPDIERLKENINSIISQVDELVIVDNGSQNIAETEAVCKDFDIHLIKLEKNMGIAYALNTICEYFHSSGYKWTLTLDQDSVSPSNLISELSEHIDDNIGIIGPRIVYRNNENVTDEMHDTVEDVSWIITSASLTNLDAWKKCGGFDNKMFIDGVDKDICFNMRKNGFKILKINSVELLHELGNLSCKKFLGKTIYVTNHSPFRIYYMVRNSFYLDRKYQMHDSKKYVTKIFLKILIWEKNKASKLKAFFKGISDKNNI